MLRMREDGATFREISHVIGKARTTCGDRWRAITHDSEQVPQHPSPQFDNLIGPRADIDEIIDQLEAAQALRLKLEPVMTVAEVSIETGGKPVGFTPTSCWHLGGMYVHYQKFREQLNRVLKIDRLYWGTHGDDWEAFPPGWASTVFNNLIPPHIQRQLVGKVVDKLSDHGKLLYSCWGNHPAFVERLTGEDPHLVVYSGKVPYFAGKGIVKLRVDDQLYVLSVAHSFPGTSYHNPTHAPSRQLMQQVPQADFVIQGHLHDFAYQERTHHNEAVDAGLQCNRIAHLVQVGTAKAGPDPYTIRKWSRGVFIWPTFVLSAKTHTIHRVHDDKTLKFYLDRDDF